MTRKIFHSHLAKTGLFITAIFLFFFQEATATHIRAGEITAERLDDPLTYRFTFIGFRDRGSTIPFGGGNFNFGDGVVIENVSQSAQISVVPINDDIDRVEFSVVHSYQAPEQYIVSYEEEYRNDDILNMANSVVTTFYVESMIEIDPFIGTNNYPILTVPPIDFAAVGALFIHNPGAFDQDGDSLSYKFVTPRQSRTQNVNSYRTLNSPEFYSNYSTGSEEGTEPTLTLNRRTGDLVWNAPGDAIQNGVREYNVAFMVEEWREIAGKWIRLSYIIRDMQIIVEETDNERPNLEVPEDICVAAGTTVSEIVQGTDPDQHPVRLEAFGGPFEVPSPATYSPFPPEFQESPGFLTFEWETSCGHVRERPYEVQFKVTDNPDVGPSLVNFETFRITVVGPAPRGLTTAVQPGKSIQLNWDDYSCSNADQMQIWRRVGSYEFEPDECQVGIPANTGYQLIDTVDISTTAYLDTNKGKGLAAGANYCYRLVAVFSKTGGRALSYVSEEACDSLIVDAPVITNVDVQSTSNTDGEILVRWAPPYQINQTIHPPDYTYDLFRAEGMTGANYEMIASGISDTVFTDTGLNTHGNAYNYFVRFYDSGGILVDSSASASSVKLQLRPLLRSIEVNWTAEVPWSLQSQDFPYHYIYRDQVLSDAPDQLVLIDSVDASARGLSYLDNGSFNNESLDEQIEYCYYVTTQGSYDNSLLPEPLINRSQISCAQPNDTIPPCRPPQLAFSDSLDCEAIVAQRPCETNLFSNSLTWEVNEDPDCDDDIISYNVYFSPTGLEADYARIASVDDPEFSHDNLTSLKGCYKVSSVDRSGNESDLTEPLCNDNCPVYLFPNAFTPNNDGKNDVFTPLNNNEGTNVSGFENVNCPRFVEAVVFRVYNRTGTEVFSYDSFENPNGILIRWDGTNQQGQELPVGVYYYEAKVTFDVLNPDEARKTLKGWIQLLR